MSNNERERNSTSHPHSHSRPPVTGRRRPASEVPRPPTCIVTGALSSHRKSAASLPEDLHEDHPSRRSSVAIDHSTPIKLSSEGTLRRNGSVSRPPEFVTRNRSVRSRSGSQAQARRLSLAKSNSPPKAALSPKKQATPPIEQGKKASSVRSQKASSINSGLQVQRDPTTDSDLSDISLKSDKSSGQPRIGEVFGVGAKRKYGEGEMSPEEERDWMRTKEKALKMCKDFGHILKLVGHDVFESAQSWGRLFTPYAGLIGPVVILILWTWDSLQLVHTNQNSCKSLYKRALSMASDWHKMLTDCQKHLDPEQLQHDDIKFLRISLYAVFDSFEAVYEKTVEQKNRCIVERYVFRKDISDELTSAKSLISEAQATFLTTITVRGYVISVQTNLTVGRLEAGLVEMVAALKQLNDKQEADQKDLKARTDKYLQSKELKDYRLRFAELIVELYVSGIYSKNRTESSKVSPNPAIIAQNIERSYPTLKGLYPSSDDFKKEVETLVKNAINKEKKEEKRESDEERQEFEELKNILKQLDEEASHDLFEDSKDLSQERRQQIINDLKAVKAYADGSASTQQKNVDFYKERNKLLSTLASRGINYYTNDSKANDIQRRPSSLSTIRSTPGSSLKTPEKKRMYHREKNRDSTGSDGDNESTIKSRRTKQKSKQVPEPEMIDSEMEGLVSTEKEDRINYKTYQKLSFPFSKDLKQPLWTPSDDCRIGDVGYIDTTHGSFRKLFSAPKKDNITAFQKLPPFPVVEYEEKTNDLSVAQRSKSAAKSLIFRRKDSKLRRRVLRSHYMNNTNASESAYLCVELSKHRRYTSISEIQEWFDKSADIILDFFNKKKNGHKIQKDQIILVTGTLSAKDYGLMVTHKKIDAQISFKVFDPSDSSKHKVNKWGAFSVDQESDIDLSEHCVTKVSSVRKDPVWDTLLLSRLHFPKDGYRVKGHSTHK